MIFVLLSVNKAVALALEIVAVKSVAFRLASVFKLMPVLLLELDELLLLLDELLELLVLACNCTVALVGGSPNIRRTLEIVGFTTSFRIVANREELG